MRTYLAVNISCNYVLLPLQSIKLEVDYCLKNCGEVYQLVV